MEMVRRMGRPMANPRDFRPFLAMALLFLVLVLLGVLWVLLGLVRVGLWCVVWPLEIPLRV